ACSCSWSCSWSCSCATAGASLGEPVEDPGGVEGLAAVRAPADLDVVARARVHRQARLDRVVAVVAVDQVVQLAEVPALGDAAPFVRAAVLRVGVGEARLVPLDQVVDL